jgi:2-methylisocitrate lyase-like PEP mutase family enzyme
MAAYLRATTVEETGMTKLLQPDAGRAFLALHLAEKGFILPNAWDAGGAIMLAGCGFPALATTSGGIAFSLGKPDYHLGDPALGVSRDEMFDRIRAIVAAVDVPVSADLEAGYGDEPEAVAETIGLAIEAGLAGGNIEDRIPGKPRLYDEALAIARIRAARAAIDAKGTKFVLNARTDAFPMTQNGLETAVRRANLYREAGADCVFAPGAPDADAVRTLVREIRAPLNIVSGLGSVTLDPKTLLGLGVQRVSLGASMARAIFGFIREAAREVREDGTIRYAAAQIPQGELNTLFARARPS